MEAATQKKKAGGLKGKLKKTIKNVVCRPDPLLWPVVSEENENDLHIALDKYKVEIPVFTKLLWKELKLIPKEERPKPPKLPKQEGLIFGVMQCCDAVKNKECSAVILESEVNPRLIVQPVIEACTSYSIPVICLKNLRALSHSNFGIKTVCLGVRQNHCDELANIVIKIAKNFKPMKKKEDLDKMCAVADTQHSVPIVCDKNIKVSNLLLIRTNKKSRVFIPPSENNAATEVKKQFIGQDFIQFSDKNNKLDQDDVVFKKMMLKRISNNPNRVKAGKKRKTENTKL